MDNFNVHKWRREYLKENKNTIVKENEENLRKQLHTLVGNEMRLGKKADVSGASHHKDEHKRAEKELNDFLNNNPSMMDDLDTVTDHFMKQLYKENLGMSMEKIVDALLNTNDGPIGPRSVIYRALEGAQYKQASLDDLADAVLEALEIIEQNGGRLDSTEFK